MSMNVTLGPQGVLVSVDETSRVRLGTAWTTPGQGARLDVLLRLAGEQTKDGDERLVTDLQLTGYPMQDYDRERIRQVTLRVAV